MHLWWFRRVISTGATGQPHRNCKWFINTAAATILIIDTADIAQQQQRCPPLSPIALTQITESEICAHVHTRCIFDVAGLPNEMGIVVSWFELLGRMVIDQMYLPIVVRTFAH